MNSSEKPRNSSPNPLNILTQDVQKLENGLRSLIETFGILFELLLGVFYLYHKINYDTPNVATPNYATPNNDTFSSFSALLLLIFLLMIGNIAIVGISQIFGLKGQKARDSRVFLLEEVFQGIKAIKALCWEELFYEKLIKIRKIEFFNIRIIRIIDAIFNSLIRSIGFIIMLVISVWLEGNQVPLDLYSALVMINQLVYPITAFPWNIGSTVGLIFPYLRMSDLLKNREIYEEKTENEIFSTKEKKCENYEENEKFSSMGKKSENFEENDKFSKKEKKWVFLEKDEEIKMKNLKIPAINLKIEDFTVKKGGFVMIFGGNGAGKTTFLRVLLGEISVENAIISINRDNLAYVSQDTWLINDTFLANIVLDKEFNSNFFEKCLKTCDLYEEFLTKEPGFSIGLNGNRLSGGQRQRLSLCRALYQEKDLYLLDDIFSSLDEKVAEKIFRNFVIKELVDKGKTVLFIAANEKYRSFAKEAYELKEGRLIRIKEEDFEKKSREIVENSKNSNENYDKMISKENCDKKQENPLENQMKISKNMEFFQPFARNGLLRYIRALGYYTLFFIIFVSLSQQAAKHYSEIFFNTRLTSKSENSPQNPYPMTIFYMFLTLFRGLFYSFGVLKVSSTIFREFLKAIIEANMAFFEENQPGELISYLTKDIDAIDCGLPEEINGWVSNMINIIGIFAVISWEFPVLIAVCVGIGVKAFGFYREYSKNNKILKENIKKMEAGMMNELMELSQ